MVYESESVLRKQAAAARRYQRLKEARQRGTHTKEEWESILEAHGYRCAMCDISRDELIGGVLTKDHIVAISEGGSDAASNLQPLCRECNTSKRFAR